jgi:DNA repair protein RecO (recombination protein O)
MPVYEAEAIVLRQYPLSDSDRIVVFITREYGRLRAAAKGARKLQNQFAGRLEPLNHIRMEFYMREGKDLGQIRRAELIRSYLAQNPDLHSTCAFSYFAELVNEIASDNQANPALFRLLLAVLEAGAGRTISKALVRYFEIWCLRLSGFFPNYDYCSNCGKCVKNNGFYARIEAGQGWCEDCAKDQGLRVGASAVAALAAIAKLPPDKFMDHPLTEESEGDLEKLSRRLLGLHLEKQLKSYKILSQSFQGL